MIIRRSLKHSAGVLLPEKSPDQLPDNILVKSVATVGYPSIIKLENKGLYLGVNNLSYGNLGNRQVELSGPVVTLVQE